MIRFNPIVPAIPICRPVDGCRGMIGTVAPVVLHEQSSGRFGRDAH